MIKYEKGTFITVPNINNMDGKPSEMQSIFIWLCKYANDEGTCFPARRTLAKRAGCSLASVDKYLKQLEDDGFIKKTTRSTNINGQTSNLYQLQIIDGGVSKTILGYIENDTPPSIKNETLTKSNINSIHLTKDTDLQSDDVIRENNTNQNNPIGQLPLTFGKSYILRLHYVYRYLWKKKYGTRLVVQNNIARFGKAMKSLIGLYTEQQIAVLIFTFFNWYGGSGDNENENKYLSDNGFPIETMVKKIDIMVAYLTNYIHLEYNGNTEVEKYLKKRLPDLFNN